VRRKWKPVLGTYTTEFRREKTAMMKIAIACLLAVFVISPVFAAGGKQNGKYDIETCRKLAKEKLYVEAGRGLNRGAIKAGVQRCMQSGPSAI
jgi:hypothetical protein